MDAKFIQRGDSIDFRPERDVAVGEVVVLGSLVGVAKLDAKAVELGSLALSAFHLDRSAHHVGEALAPSNLCVPLKAEHATKSRHSDQKQRDAFASLCFCVMVFVGGA